MFLPRPSASASLLRCVIHKCSSLHLGLRPQWLCPCVSLFVLLLCLGPRTRRLCCGVSIINFHSYNKIVIVRLYLLVLIILLPKCVYVFNRNTDRDFYKIINSRYKCPVISFFYFSSYVSTKIQ